MNPDDRVDSKREKQRYEEHNNDVNDKGYQKFVMPIVNSVIKYFNTENSGLDFGAGTGPVVSKLLLEKGYNIKKYDPLFFDDLTKLDNKYDYVVCCEVMEHFHDPLKEFRLLRSLLCDEGMIFCMTYLYDEETDFGEWYYKNDETHVFFYHREAIKWICENIGFSIYKIEGRVIKLQK